MNTEHSFLYSFMLLYMLFNVYTDLTSMRTKNWWHSIYLFGLLLYGFLVGAGVEVLFYSALGLMIGLLLSFLPKAKLGAGDVKMLIVIFSFIGLIFGFHQFTFHGLYILMYLIASFLIMSVLQLIKNKRTNRSFRFYSYKITEEGNLIAPEAIPLFIACIALPLLGGF